MEKEQFLKLEMGTKVRLIYCYPLKDDNSFFAMAGATGIITKINKRNSEMTLDNNEKLLVAGCRHTVSIEQSKANPIVKITYCQVTLI